MPKTDLWKNIECARKNERNALAWQDKEERVLIAAEPGNCGLQKRCAADVKTRLQKSMGPTENLAPGPVRS